MKVSFVSLGCAKALVDTEVMMGLVEEAGGEITPKVEEADFVVINTCSFIYEAKQETEETLREFLKSGKKVIVVGCYVNRYREKLKKEFPQIYALVDTEQIHRILDVLKGKKLSPSHKLYLMDCRTPRKLSTPSSWAYLKISEGCSHSCSFCAIPFIRGPYRSREPEDIAEEARKLEELGVLEINLVSQDTSYYYQDKGEKRIARLVKKIIDSTKRVWIRLLYLYPEEVTDELIEVFQESRVASYFDIPFQHSHPEVLKLMGRSMDGRRSLRLLEKIRKKVEGAVIRTSLIVGFPGEGKREFEDLVSWVKTAQFDRLGVFRYSPEEGTLAYKLGDPVPFEEKKRRQDLILQVQSEISARKNARKVGRTYEVLIEGTLMDAPDYYFARSYEFAPEVDGGIYVRKTREASLNDFAKVKITHSYTYDLEGELL